MTQERKPSTSTDLDDAPDENILRIDYDDAPDEVVDKVNKVLASHGLRFVDDRKRHDGFCLYSIADTAIH